MRALIAVGLAMALAGCGKDPAHDRTMAGLFTVAELGELRGAMTSVDLDYLFGAGGWTEGDFALFFEASERARYSRGIDEQIAKHEKLAVQTAGLGLSSETWEDLAKRGREFKEKHAPRFLSEYELVAQALRSDNLAAARDALRKHARMGLGRAVLGEE